MLSVISACLALGQFAEGAFFDIQTGIPAQDIIMMLPAVDEARIYVDAVLRAEAGSTTLRTLHADAAAFGGMIALECINGKPQGVRM